MDPKLLFLILVASLFLLGVLGEFVFQRTRIPDVIWLVGAGALLGPVYNIVPLHAIDNLVPYFGMVALIIMLFQGGSTLVLGEVAAAAPRATLLGVLGFSITVLVMVLAGTAAWSTGLLEMADPALAAVWSPLHGVMIGAILGGSSSLVIMPSIQAARIEARTGRLVEMESTITDALCIVVTIASIEFVRNGGGDLGASAAELAMQFGMALLVAALGAVIWIPLLHMLNGLQHAWTFTLAALFLLYVLVESAGGNPAMGILAFAILVGNGRTLARLVRVPGSDLKLELDGVTRAIHGQMAFIMKSFFFTFIGLSLPANREALIAGVVLGILLLVARIPAVYLSVWKAGLRRDQIRLVTIAIPRGMAAGILATMPASSGIEGTENLSGLVFGAVLTSIVIFTLGFGSAARANALAEAAERDDPLPPGAAPPSPPTAAASP